MLTFNDYFKRYLKQLKRSDNREYQRLHSECFLLSQHILGKRIELGLSQQKVADKLKLSLAEYRDYEHGMKDATKEQYQAVLDKMLQL